MARKKAALNDQRVKPKQPSIMNFFTKAEKQQSKLFTTHVTRPRAISGPSSSATSACKIKGYSSSLHQENRQLTAELPESLFVPKKLTSTPGPVDIRTSPVTDLVIPETPEGISFSPCQSAIDLHTSTSDVIPETPPSIVHKESTVKNTVPLLEQYCSSHLGLRDGTVKSRKSKLSRKYGHSKRGTQSLDKIPEKSLDEDGAIKPSRIFLKKQSLNKPSSMGSKRPPDRGASPFAKRSQVNIYDKSLSSSARKHLFTEVPQDSLDIKLEKTFVTSGKNTILSNTIDCVDLGKVIETESNENEDILTRRNKRNCKSTQSGHLFEERIALSDNTNKDTLRENTCSTENSSSLDVSVEWDDINEALLAALDEDNLEEQLVVNQQSSKASTAQSQFQRRQDNLVPRLAHLSPFKKVEEQESAQLPASLVRYMVKFTQIKENGDQVLYLKNLASGSSHTCFVSGVWNQIMYSEGDLLAVHGKWSESKECHINQDEGFIIYKPDFLVTGTAVAGSIRCMRRSVFDQFFKGIDKGNKAMILGTLVHEVFDKALWKQKFEDAYLKKFVADSLQNPSIRNKMYSMQLKESELMKDIEEYFKPLQLFAKRYLRECPSPQGSVDMKWDEDSVKCLVSIPKVCDIEDNMWSPRWGLKGKVDVTTEVKIHRKDQVMKKDKFVLPLELKTGKQTNSIEHRSQVMLYSLMMKDLDSQTPPLGLLLYLKTGALLSVMSSHMDQRELIHLRNQLAFNVSKSAKKDLRKDTFQPPELPPPIEDDFTCGRCCHATTCAIMNKEEGGCCHSDLIVQRCKAEDSGVFQVTFKHRESVSPFRFEVGDWLIASDENTGQIAQLIGTVTSISPESLTLSTDSPLSTYPSNRSIYTLDKNESYDNMSSSFINLAFLMSSTAHRSRLRDVIIDLCSPSNVSPRDIDSLSNEAKAILATMNEDQHSAIMKVLHNEDYTLIMGMPGTGKTSTVVALVRILVLEGKSVLLTSYTHSAVDNILLKLKEANISFLRLGSTYRIHHQLHQYSESTVLRGCGVDDVANLIETTPVIAATSLGVKSPLLSHKWFDYCIIDEASQISQPVCLAPLFKTSKFVLVGDHKQLPPLVQSTTARVAGMDESLFQRLASGCPSSVSQLRFQYRMHPTIMDLSNAFTYAGALHCGNQQVESHLLDLPHYTPNVPLTAWLQLALLPETVVRFFSTEQLHNEETERGVNHVEANHVKATVEHLISGECCSNESNQLKLGTRTCGCNPGEIGIISPYRKQCHLLQSMGMSKDVEVNTIDKYQGRDKNVIIVSFTLQQQQGKTILEDARRINVALTRAKKKLIMFGNGSVLCLTACMSKLMGILEQKGFISIISGMDKI
ncbi:putative DNA replication ATP-dependent helicase/nuclease DNA2 [Apostichopus japonicus]|uniref:DNA helicase n=1 Tax=Stichopus japonicus TaxID=307972 RepID=A0A2G8KYM7_STIJA|nr:putative DNA replication ATP-dependent helicase/nuclease DNA2 [Apostichopus japonicus]